MIYFEVRAPSSTSPPSPREGFPHSLGIFLQRSHKKRNYNGLHKTRVHNSNS